MADFSQQVAEQLERLTDTLEGDRTTVTEAPLKGKGTRSDPVGVSDTGIREEDLTTDLQHKVNQQASGGGLASVATRAPITGIGTVARPVTLPDGSIDTDQLATAVATKLNKVVEAARLSGNVLTIVRDGSADITVDFTSLAPSGGGGGGTATVSPADALTQAEVNELAALVLTFTGGGWSRAGNIATQLYPAGPPPTLSQVQTAGYNPTFTTTWTRGQHVVMRLDVRELDNVRGGYYRLNLGEEVVPSTDWLHIGDTRIVSYFHIATGAPATGLIDVEQFTKPIIHTDALPVASSSASGIIGPDEFTRIAESVDQAHLHDTPKLTNAQLEGTDALLLDDASVGDGEGSQLKEIYVSELDKRYQAAGAGGAVTSVDALTAPPTDVQTRPDDQIINIDGEWWEVHESDQDLNLISGVAAAQTTPTGGTGPYVGIPTFMWSLAGSGTGFFMFVPATITVAANIMVDFYGQGGFYTEVPFEPDTAANQTIGGVAHNAFKSEDVRAEDTLVAGSKFSARVFNADANFARGAVLNVRGAVKHLQLHDRAWEGNEGDGQLPYVLDLLAESAVLPTDSIPTTVSTWALRGDAADKYGGEVDAGSTPASHVGFGPAVPDGVLGWFADVMVGTARYARYFISWHTAGYTTDQTRAIKIYPVAGSTQYFSLLIKDAPEVELGMSQAMKTVFYFSRNSRSLPANVSLRIYAVRFAAIKGFSGSGGSGVSLQQVRDLIDQIIPPSRRLPPPTLADAAEAAVVNPTGQGYELQPLPTPGRRPPAPPGNTTPYEYVQLGDTDVFPTSGIPRSPALWNLATGLDPEYGAEVSSTSSPRRYFGVGPGFPDGSLGVVIDAYIGTRRANRFYWPWQGLRASGSRYMYFNDARDQYINVQVTVSQASGYGLTGNDNKMIFYLSSPSSTLPTGLRFVISAYRMVDVSRDAVPFPGVNTLPTSPRVGQGITALADIQEEGGGVLTIGEGTNIKGFFNGSPDTGSLEGAPANGVEGFYVDTRASGASTANKLFLVIDPQRYHGTPNRVRVRLEGSSDFALKEYPIAAVAGSPHIFEANAPTSGTKPDRTFFGTARRCKLQVVETGGRLLYATRPLTNGQRYEWDGLVFQAILLNLSNVRNEIDDIVRRQLQGFLTIVRNRVEGIAIADTTTARRENLDPFDPAYTIGAQDQGVFLCTGRWFVPPSSAQQLSLGAAGVNFEQQVFINSLRSSTDYDGSADEGVKVASIDVHAVAAGVRGVKLGEVALYLAHNASDVAGTYKSYTVASPGGSSTAGSVQCEIQISRLRTQ